MIKNYFIVDAGDILYQHQQYINRAFARGVDICELLSFIVQIVYDEIDRKITDINIFDKNEVLCFADSLVVGFMDILNNELHESKSSRNTVCFISDNYDDTVLFFIDAYLHFVKNKAAFPNNSGIANGQHVKVNIHGMETLAIEYICLFEELKNEFSTCEKRVC